MIQHRFDHRYRVTRLKFLFSKFDYDARVRVRVCVSIVSLRDAISRVSKRYARAHASLVARRFFPSPLVVPRPADARHAPSPRGINYTRLKPVSWRNSWLKLKLSLSPVFSPFLAVDVGKNKRFLREQPGISSCRQVLAARLTSSPANIVHSASIEPAFIIVRV